MARGPQAGYSIGEILFLRSISHKDAREDDEGARSSWREDQPLLTVADVAKRCQVHPRTVQRAIRARRLKAARLGARGAYRIRPEDLDAWVGESTMEGTQSSLPGARMGAAARPPARAR